MPERTTRRDIDTIQAELVTTADALKRAADLLNLVSIMTELEEHYPANMDTARIQEGEICPPLAWGIGVDIGHAKIQIEEAVQSLQCASRRTEVHIRADWIEEKIKDVNDPSTRTLMEFILKEQDSSSEDIDDGRPTRARRAKG